VHVCMGPGIERSVLLLHHENDPLLHPTMHIRYVKGSLLVVTTGRFHGEKVKQVAQTLGFIRHTHLVGHLLSRVVVVQ